MHKPTSSAASTEKLEQPRKRKLDARATILDAAERLFAEHGFEGCTLRDVADKAKVNQGMIHYFFKTKETLFREAYVRRGQVIVDERLRLLDAEEALAGQKPIPVERLIELFLRPAIDVAMRGPGGRAFVRMQARLQLESSRFGDHIRRALYDDSSRRFVAAFARSLPSLTQDDVCWRFVFMLGTYQYVLADTGRLEVISDGRYTGRDFESAFKQMVRFLAAGIQADPINS
jgi:AcrR family transcriptional regulator